MRTALVLVVVALAAGRALADSDPLEAMAAQQAAAQAPDAKMIAPFFKGDAPRTDWNILLEENQCYWFSAVAEGKVKAVALYLWGPDGKRLAEGKAKKNDSVTMAYCTFASGMHKFQAKVAGKARYVVGVFSKVAPKQSAVPMVKGPDVGPICDKTARAAAPNASRVGDFFDGQGGSFGHKDHAGYSIQMDAGKCYWVIGCGEPGHVKSMSLYLWGPDNKRITEAKPDSPNVMVGHCAQATGMFKVEAKVTGGSGVYKVGVYKK